MRYPGGKSYNGQEIANYINSHKGPIYEPFCGGLNVTRHLRPPIHASDISKELILLYEAIRAGWLPPIEVSEDEYQELKLQSQDGEYSPLISFVGFACSWGCKWFGGYARGEYRNFCFEIRSALIEDIKSCNDVIFSQLNYQNLQVKDSVIYCDPPYRTTTDDGYAQNGWCSYTFWSWAEKMTKENIVIVSEYECPDSFVCVKELVTQRSCLSKTRSNKLFKHKSQVNLFDDLFSL